MKLLPAIGFIASLFIADHAQAGDALVEGAKLCTRHLPRYEREYGIPTHLLSAIASTESGRYHEGMGIKVPWPWTINAAGKGYFYNSKAEAVAAARKLRASGVQSMDVGCMQVNIMHHPTAFSSIDEAFEPQKNVAYAASFLRSLYEEDNHSWKQAAADYHSKTTSRGQEYVGLVYNSWYNIIDKLRAARMHVPDSSVAAMNNLKSGPDLKKNDAPKAIKVASKPVIQPLPEQVGKKIAAYRPPRMNSIMVNGQEARRDGGIIVVRPDIKVVDAPVASITTTTLQPASSLTLSDAMPLNDLAPAASGNVRVNEAGQKQSGPTFIFSN